MDSLANLKDIHLPPSIGWWPLAPGWYVLIGIIFLVSSLLLYKIYQRYKNQRYKSQALKLLAHYYENYKNEPNIPETCSRLSELLKQVALVYFARDQVASLRGDEWIRFLNQTSKKLDFWPMRHALIELPYQKNNEKMELDALFQLVKLWIKQRGQPCLK